MLIIRIAFEFHQERKMLEAHSRIQKEHVDTRFTLFSSCIASITIKKLYDFLGKISKTPFDTHKWPKML